MKFQEIKAITPSEAQARKAKEIPKQVLEVFNELIVQNYCNCSAIVKQPEALDCISARFPDVPRALMIESGWLDVEEIYQKAGWTVEYDKPGYNETYDPFFKFTGKKR